jgi:hypothetical protein
MSDAEMGPHEVWCDTQNAISHRCNCMASTYIDKIEEMQKRIEKLEAALRDIADSDWCLQDKAREALKGDE